MMKKLRKLFWTMHSRLKKMSLPKILFFVTVTRSGYWIGIKVKDFNRYEFSGETGTPPKKLQANYLYREPFRLLGFCCVYESMDYTIM